MSGDFDLRQSAHNRAEEIAEEKRQHDGKQERAQKKHRVKQREQEKAGERNGADVERPDEQVVKADARRDDGLFSLAVA